MRNLFIYIATILCCLLFLKSVDAAVVWDGGSAVQTYKDAIKFGTNEQIKVDSSNKLKLVDSSNNSVDLADRKALDIFHAQDFETALTWSTGNNATFLTAGTLDGALSVETSSPLGKLRSFKYTAGSSSQNDWISSPAISLDLKQRGQFVGISFFYKWSGSVDVEFVVKCTAGDTAEFTDALDVIESASSSARFSTSIFISSACTEIKYGFHFINAPTNGDILVFDDVELSTNPYVYKNIDETAFWGSVKWSSTTNCIWQSSSTSWTNYSSDADCDDNARTIRGYYNSTNGDIGNSDGQLPQIKFSRIPSGVLRCEAKGAFFTNGTQLTSYRFSDGTNTTSGNSMYAGTTGQYFPYFSGEFKYDSDQSNVTIQIQFKHTGDGGASEVNVAGPQSELEISCYHYPLQTSEHIITPAKSNMSDWESYTPTTQGFGTPTIEYAKWRRVGDSMQVMVRLTTGTVTADEARIGLPSGYTILSTVDEYVSAGFLAFGGFVQSHPATVLITGGDSFLNFAKSDGASIDQLTIAQTGSQLLGNSHQISFTATVPIQGWSSNAQFLAAIPVQQTCYVKDVKASGTGGGTFTSGAWQTRDLNTTSGNCSFLSLSSNQITLQAGKYELEAFVPGYKVNAHKAKLVSDPSGTPVDEIIGSNEQIDNAVNVISHSKIFGTLLITSSKTFEIQHRCATTGATTGFGNASSLGVDEVYTVVKITKVK